MPTKPWAIGLVLLATALTTAGQVFYKLGADQLEFNFLAIITNHWLIIGAAVYLTSAVVLLFALKGGELSVLYPFVATSYIWVTLVSSALFHEAIHAWKWAGIVCIMLGVSCIGWGSTK
ncbi:MAG: hypothetical protein V1735_02825 [Nanoarchaeota archaeon]